jgi:hypothetical protein
MCTKIVLFVGYQAGMLKKIKKNVETRGGHTLDGHATD